MATETTNFGLTKDANTDYYSIDTVNDNLDKIDKALGNAAKFETAGGNGTAITLIGLELEDGHSKTFIVSANNNGAATTINGKSLYKPGTTQAPKLIAGKAVTVWYNGTHFFIKASAEGTALAENVLADKTFSSDDDTGINGTMQDNGPSTSEIIDIATEGEEYIITKGFHSGLRKIRAKISGLVASVIKSGTKVGGITGTFTSDATAVAGNILNGKTAYKNGSKLTGTMTNKGSKTFTPSDVTQKDTGGYYSDITVNPRPTLSGNSAVGDVLAGKTFYNSDYTKKIGTMVDRGTANHTLPINGSYTIPSGKHSGTGKVTQSIPTQVAQTITPSTANQTIASGRYLSGAQTILGDPDLISANILQGKNIFGVIGSAINGAGMKKYASGTVKSDGTTHKFAFSGGYINGGYRLSVTGLTFKPTHIFIFHLSSNNRFISYASDHIRSDYRGNFVCLDSTGSNSDPLVIFPTGNAHVDDTSFNAPYFGFLNNATWYWFAFG